LLLDVNYDEYSNEESVHLKQSILQYIQAPLSDDYHLCPIESVKQMQVSSFDLFDQFVINSQILSILINSLSFFLSIFFNCDIIFKKNELNRR